MWYYVDPIKTYGRFGNVLITIMNLISLCIRNGHNFYFRHPDPVFHVVPNMCFIHNKGWVIGEQKDVEEENMPHLMLYYNLPFKLYEKEKREICIKYISNILVIPDIQSKDTLVIHIRAGDIFNKHIHSSYIQPPFEYYRFIIDNNNYKYIIIVTEPDMSNPVILKLVETYPNIHVFSRTLNEDIATIIGAQNLVIGTGSFAYILSLCSLHLKRLYCFEIQNVYWKNSDYEIIVLQSEPSYPKQWNGDSNILLDRKWKISVKSMDDFIETPKMNWEN